MKDERKAKKQLIEELVALRQQSASTHAALANGELALRQSEHNYKSLVNQSPDPIFVSRIDDFVFTEVNERKRAEEALRQYESMVSASSDLMMFVDPTYTYQAVNPAYCDAHQNTQEEILGRTVAEVLGQKIFETQIKPQLDRCLSGERVNFEFWWDSPSLGRRYMQAKYDPFYEVDGSVSGVLVDVRDTTDSKQAEKLKSAETKYRDLYENAPDLFCSVDCNTAAIEECNETLATALGYTKEEILGRHISFVYHPDSEQDRREVFHMFVETGEVRNAELALKRKDGSKIEVILNVSAVRDVEGKILYSRSIWRDITERKQAEEALRVSREQLRRLAARLHAVREEERVHIARELHDQLGQALTGLQIDLTRLANKPPETQQAMRERIDLMVALLDSTVDITRGISARLRPPVLDDMGLAAAVEWQADDFSQRTGIACDVVADLGGASLEAGRTTAVFRIMQEALTNVARHAEASHVSVLLEREAGEAVLHVEDDGKGISDTVLDAVSSLGLVGMRERAGALGGRVIIEPRAEGGTTVELRMPVGSPEAKP